MLSPLLFGWFLAVATAVSFWLIGLGLLEYGYANGTIVHSFGTLACLGCGLIFFVISVATTYERCCRSSEGSTVAKTLAFWVSFFAYAAVTYEADSWHRDYYRQIFIREIVDKEVAQIVAGPDSRQALADFLAGQLITPDRFWFKEVPNYRTKVGIRAVAELRGLNLEAAENFCEENIFSTQEVVYVVKRKNTIGQIKRITARCGVNHQRAFLSPLII